MTTRPGYIPESIVGAPIDFPWHGALGHLGPAEAVTPLMKMLDKKTLTAYLTLGAGILQWAGWRLLNHTDVSFLLELSDALFAYQVDPRYFKRSAHPKGAPPDQPPALSGALQLGWLMVKAANPERYWHNYYAPISEVFHGTHLVRHILPEPAQKPFGDWLKNISKRLDVIAPKPDEPFRKKSTFATVEEYRAFLVPHRGVALPPQVLAPSFEYRPEEREALLNAHLEKLDWRSNRYLQSPDEMRGQGFEGTPYRHP